MMDDAELVRQLRGGINGMRITVLGNVQHGEACLEAADRIEALIAERDSALEEAARIAAADLEKAWEMGRDAGVERAAGRYATRSEHASRLFEMDYPEAEIDSKCYSHRADEADAIADEVRALTPPADLAQRVKE